MPEIEEMKEKLEQYEQEQNAAQAETARKFDLKALSESTRKIQVITDPDLGEIRFGLLTDDEVKTLTLNTIKEDSERADRVIHAMLQKAEPTFTYEDYKALPFDVKGALTILLSRTFSRFLRLQQRLGSQPAPQPRQPGS